MKSLVLKFLICTFLLNGVTACQPIVSSPQTPIVGQTSKVVLPTVTPLPTATIVIKPTDTPMPLEQKILQDALTGFNQEVAKLRAGQLPDLPEATQFGVMGRATAASLRCFDQKVQIFQTLDTYFGWVAAVNRLNTQFPKMKGNNCALYGQVLTTAQVCYDAQDAIFSLTMHEALWEFADSETNPETKLTVLTKLAAEGCSSLKSPR